MSNETHKNTRTTEGATHSNESGFGTNREESPIRLAGRIGRTGGARSEAELGPASNKESAKTDPTQALPFTETFVEISSGTRAIVDRGPANDPLPFLLVHGLASNKHMYDGVGQALAAAGRRSISIDQRGHGHSAKPEDGYDLATVSADLVEVLTSLSIDKAVVVGQSWGGNVVIEMGVRYPERLAGIVCVDGGFIRLGSKFATWEDCAAALKPPKLIGTPLATLQGWMRSAHPDWPESSRLGEIASFEVRDDQTIAPWLTLDRHMAILHDLFLHDPAAAYPLLQLPTLMVPAGSKASFTDDKTAAVEQAISLLPNGTAYWFHEADHDIHAQFPRELTAVLLDFAKDLS